jgi:hypothetical protein
MKPVLSRCTVCVMAGSRAPLLRQRRRWLAFGVVVVALAVAGIVIATQSGSTTPGFLVLVHPTWRADTLAVEAINKSNHKVWTNGVNMSPRTSAPFSLPPNEAVTVDIPGSRVAPHSVHRLASTVATAPKSPAPGNYWVWTLYAPVGVYKMQVAYTELTILAP